MEQEVLDAPVTSKIAVYSPIEAGIALMLEKHGHVLSTPPVVTNNPPALTRAKAGRSELVKFRTTLEKARKEEKAESLAYGRLVDSEAARIQAFATPLELAYDSVIVAEEDRLEAIRQEELEAERQRIAGHRARIQSIKDVRETANMCRTADRLKQLIDGMPDHLEQPFEEFQGEAETAFNEVCTVLQQLHGAKVEAEAAAVELKRQQDELAAQRAEADRIEVERQAAARAEADRLQADRDAEEERQRIQRQKDANDLAERRAAFEQEQAQARAAQQAEADRLTAQQRVIDEQQASQRLKEYLDANKPAPLSAQDIADGVVDAEVNPETLLLPDMGRCCEKAAPLGLVVCPDCEETSAAYQAEMGRGPAAVGPPTLRLGQINERLAPIQLTADGLRTLGFEPAGRERAAVLYHASSWPLIQAALVKHINALPELQSA